MGGEPTYYPKSRLYPTTRKMLNILDNEGKENIVLTYFQPSSHEEADRHIPLDVSDSPPQSNVLLHQMIPVTLLVCSTKSSSFRSIPLRNFGYGLGWEILPSADTIGVTYCMGLHENKFENYLLNLSFATHVRSNLHLLSLHISLKRAVNLVNC